MKFNTKIIHGNQHPDKSTGAVMPPIVQSSTFAQKELDSHQDYEYSRVANPTRQALENSIASLEGGARGLAFSSGLAAIDCVIRHLPPGSEIITSVDLYGGSYRLFSNFYEPLGYRFHYVDMDNPNHIEEKINGNTKLIWLETPTNPIMKLVDLKAVGELANQHQILLAVDNTFATPYIHRPIEFGADIVMHSASKYLGGHSDVVAGLLVAKSEELGKQLHFIQYAAGAILGPQDSYLVLRGIKTLHLRMERHCQNAEQVAKFLSQHFLVNQVYYPGLKSNPYFELAKQQMHTRYGGVVSFNFKSGRKEDVGQFLSKLKLFTLADSLGGVESLINYSAEMSHQSVPREMRLAMGITDDLVRLSIGIEDVEDIIDDLAQALS